MFIECLGMSSPFHSLANLTKIFLKFLVKNIPQKSIEKQSFVLKKYLKVYLL